MDSLSRALLPPPVADGMLQLHDETGGAGDDYCKYGGSKQPLQLSIASTYLAAVAGALCAATVTRSLGRRWSMFTGGATFLSGTVVAATAQTLATLTVGRVLLGVGVGFVLQSVPVYISEMAPARLRGVLNVSFQLMVTIGILSGFLAMSGETRVSSRSAWRVAMAISVVPGCIVTVGSLFLPDTPNSLINRDSHEEAESLLRRIRGTEDVAGEYGRLVAAGEQCRITRRPWKSLAERRYRGPLVMSVLLAIFQQLAALQSMLLYAPVMFRTLAVGAGDPARTVAVILAVFNVAATFVCFLDVDRLGRRKVFLQGGSQMIFCQVMVGTMLGIKHRSGEPMASFSQTYAGFVLLFVCLFVSAFAYSWGPLGWLVPSEVFPLEVRPAGQSVAVAVNMLGTFAMNQALPPLLCRMKYALFFFFAGCVAAMTAAVMLFLPETKSTPIEEVMLVWKNHWFWGRFIADDDVLNVGGGSSSTEVELS